jgi:hypothetical protein
MHPFFHTVDTVINPGSHGTWTSEKLKKVWKDILPEYDTTYVARSTRQPLFAQDVPIRMNQLSMYAYALTQKLQVINRNAFYPIFSNLAPQSIF